MSNLTALDRLRRLLAIIPWVAAEGGMALDEVTRRFDYPRDDLLEDIWFVVQMIGVAPFGPGDMLEAGVEDDWVHIEYSHWFARPMTLRPEEVLGLLAAGQSVAEFSIGDDLGPLGRALTKLSAMVEPEVRDAIDVRLGVADDELLEALQQARADRRIVEIDYYSYGRDELTTRVVEPHALTATGTCPPTVKWPAPPGSFDSTASVAMRSATRCTPSRRRRVQAPRAFLRTVTTRRWSCCWIRVSAG